MSNILKYDLEDIKNALEDRNLKLVAQKTGLSADTLYKIKNGERQSINLNTYKILLDYLFSQN